MKRLTPEQSRESWLLYMGNHGWDYQKPGFKKPSF